MTQAIDSATDRKCNGRLELLYSCLLGNSSYPMRLVDCGPLSRAVLVVGVGYLVFGGASVP